MLSLYLSAGLAAVAPIAPVIAPPVPIVAPVAAPSLPQVDPAQLALASVTANALFRDGTMARMFDRMLSTGPNGYASSFLDMSLADVMGMAPQLGGTLPKDSPELHMTFRQMATKNDPYFEQRIAAIHQVVVSEAARLGPRFEPQLREGLAQSMARRFTLAQLTDMNRFFSSASGRAFGDEMYLIWMDPAVLRSVMSTFPALGAEFPTVTQRVKAASDRFPWPEKPKPAAPAPPAKKLAPKSKR